MAARIQRLSGSGTRFLWSFDRRLLSLSCLAIKTIGEETWNVGSSLTGGHKTENDSGVHGQPSTAAPSVFDAMKTFGPWAQRVDRVHHSLRLGA